MNSDHSIPAAIFFAEFNCYDTGIRLDHMKRDSLFLLCMNPQRFLPRLGCSAFQMQKCPYRSADGCRLCGASQPALAGNFFVPLRRLCSFQLLVSGPYCSSRPSWTWTAKTSCATGRDMYDGTTVSTGVSALTYNPGTEKARNVLFSNG